LSNWPETPACADPVRDPVVRLAANHAEVSTDEIDKASTLTNLMIEPHASLVARDDDRKTALAAPAPFLAYAEGRIA
jgi:hypothetical protein